MAVKDYEVILVGAGFGSIATFTRLRKLGYKCRFLEKGNELGGIWYWNCYPGARVDSDAPIYQLFDKDIWEGFSFTERYPGWRELRRYFAYLEEKLSLAKEIDFGVAVEGATFDEKARKWHVKCSGGQEYTCSWFIPSIGFAAKAYIPPYKGIEKFKGQIHHTALWPQEGIDLKDKRLAVIGTGASGVQTIQDSGREAKHLTVFQRTPNLAVPMNQKPQKYDEVEKLKAEGRFDEAFNKVFTTFAGFNYDFQDKKTFDDTPEQRKAFFQDLFTGENKGGFCFWLNTYPDMLKDEAANREAYNFWRDWVRGRLDDPKKQEILAPMEPPHPWGTKRPSLEQNYYEVYNLPNVDLIDVSDEKGDPIEEITETGIRTRSGKFAEVDVIALATGFDSVTGSLAQLDIRGTNGESISDHWKSGLKTSVGIALHNFPNMFFLYGPQAPTAFSNGPTCIQLQAIWLARVMKEIKEQGITRWEATAESEIEWTKKVHAEWEGTLFPQAKSWYQGANIPGRKVEPLNYVGGIPSYIENLDKSLENNYQGWTTAAA